MHKLNRFPKVAELTSACWLEICGRINTCMLSLATLYTAYLEFKTTTASMDLNSNLLRPCLDLLEAKFISSLSIWMQKEGGGCDTRYYQCELGFLTAAAAALWDFTHHIHSLEKKRNRMASSIQKRADGWQETELGEFFKGSGEDHEELEMSVLEVKGW